MYRSEGQLGLADYYDGDLGSCRRRVAAALIAATKNHDAAAQILFLSATAVGYLMQNLSDSQAIQYAKEAIAIASGTPDAGAPQVANAILIQALARTGKISEAEGLVGKLLAEPTLDPVERFYYLSSAANAELAARKLTEAAKYFEQAIYKRT